MEGKRDHVERDALQSILEEARCTLSVTSASNAEGTFLRRLSDSCIQMAGCYVSDADHFIDEGDWVTAFAAANYASEWLICGSETGLLSIGDICVTPGKEIGKPEKDIIDDERMARYLDITLRARAKILVAVPERSFGIRMAEWCLGRSDDLYRTAKALTKEGDYAGAFGTVNCSHAWLDFGARAGLFDVGGDDVLFTLYER